MTRPQRGAHRFTEEPVPALFIEEDTPLPAIPSSRSLDLASVPDPLVPACRRDRFILRGEHGRIRAVAAAARDRDLPRRGRFMGTEIKSPVTSRRAPTAGSSPSSGRPSVDPRRATRVGAVSRRARGLPPPAPALLPVDGSARAPAGHLQDLPDRGPRLPGAGDPGARPPCPSTTWPPTAGRSTLFVAASIAGLFWVFGTEVAAIVLGLSAVLIGVCFLPVSWTARAAGLAAAGRGPSPPLRGQAWSRLVPVDRLAGPGDHVHVPHDDLYV